MLSRLFLSISYADVGGTVGPAAKRAKPILKNLFPLGLALLLG